MNFPVIGLTTLSLSPPPAPAAAAPAPAPLAAPAAAATLGGEANWLRAVTAPLVLLPGGDSPLAGEEVVLR